MERCPARESVAESSKRVDERRVAGLWRGAAVEEAVVEAAETDDVGAPGTRVHVQLRHVLPLQLE